MTNMSHGQIAATLLGALADPQGAIQAKEYEPQTVELVNGTAQAHATLEVAHQLERIADLLTMAREPNLYEQDHNIVPKPMLFEVLEGLQNLGDQIESALIRGLNH